MQTTIRFKGRVTKDMAWGKETFDAIITATVQEDGTLKVDPFNFEATKEETERLNEMGRNW